MRTLVLALAVVLSSLAAAAQERTPSAEIILRLDALEAELRSLRGELEQQRYRQRQLESRLERLAGGAALDAPAPAAPGTAGDPALGGTGTLGGASSAETSPVADGDDYARGMALLQRGDYAAARAALDRFVAANPDAPRAPEAAFWSAETLFVEGRNDAAAAAFAANYRAFGPEAPRAADSLFKVAVALNRMGDAERACRTLDELARRHGDLPRSLAAAVQRERARADCG